MKLFLRRSLLCMIFMIIAKHYQRGTRWRQCHYVFLGFFVKNTQSTVAHKALIWQCSFLGVPFWCNERPFPGTKERNNDKNASRELNGEGLPKMAGNGIQLEVQREALFLHISYEWSDRYKIHVRLELSLMI